LYAEAVRKAMLSSAELLGLGKTVLAQVDKNCQNGSN
jgi:hypothetical protein